MQIYNLLYALFEILDILSVLRNVFLNFVINSDITADITHVCKLFQHSFFYKAIYHEKMTYLIKHTLGSWFISV